MSQSIGVEKLKELFASRIPPLQDVLAVFSVIVFIDYSWMLYSSFYKLPAWIYSLSVGQILTVYAYAFIASLIDSLVVLMAVMVFDFAFFFLFRNQEEIRSRTILTSVIVLIFMIARLYLYGGNEDMSIFLSTKLWWYGAALFIGLPLVVALPKLPRVNEILYKISEMLSVFLYIYLPLSVISLIVVLIRIII